jgi:uncharacterized integral membrane protein
MILYILGAFVLGLLIGLIGGVALMIRDEKKHRRSPYL